MNQKASAEEIMQVVDRLGSGMRELVNEFGAQIVFAMINDGYTDPTELRRDLEVWRRRKQDRWLSEIPYAINRERFLGARD